MSDKWDKWLRTDIHFSVLILRHQLFKTRRVLSYMYLILLSRVTCFCTVYGRVMYILCCAIWCRTSLYNMYWLNHRLHMTEIVLRGRQCCNLSYHVKFCVPYICCLFKLQDSEMEKHFHLHLRRKSHTPQSRDSFILSKKLRYRNFISYR